jgi:hypothetical protein
MKRFVAGVCLAAALLVGQGSVSQVLATTVYSYTGNPFTDFNNITEVSGQYTTSDFVSMSFTVAGTGLAAGLSYTNINSMVDSFTFTDGRNTITDATPGVYLNASAATDASGNIIQWDVYAGTGSASTGSITTQIRTFYYPGSSSLPDGYDSGRITYWFSCSGYSCSGYSDAGSVQEASSWTRDGPPLALAAEVPLPATLPLFVAGLGALGLRGWGGKRKNASAMAEA